MKNFYFTHIDDDQLAIASTTHDMPTTYYNNAWLCHESKGIVGLCIINIAHNGTTGTTFPIATFRHTLHISGVRGIDTHLISRGIMYFIITNLHEKDHMPVEAVVLPKIMTELLVHHIPFDHRWKHLEGLRLADPNLMYLDSSTCCWEPIHLAL